MKIYNYHLITKEYLSEEQAQRDPLSGDYLIPANSTPIAPPITRENKVAVWNGESWEIVDDFVGTNLWNKSNGLKYVISKLGEVPNYELYTSIEPLGDQEWSEENQNWITLKPLAMGGEIVRQAQLTFNNEHPIFRGLLLAALDNFPLPKAMIATIPEVDTRALVQSLADTIPGNTFPFSFQKWLESSTCNPLKESDFNWLIEVFNLLALNGGFPSEVVNKYLELANNYRSNVRFAS